MTIERHWYRLDTSLLSLCLLPLAGMFRAIVALRYYLYRCRIKKIISFPVPVIVVGNITVGGTGKTPMVIWLADLLQKNGYQPGIVSRGVGGEEENIPVWVAASSDPARVGDEALLIAERTQCPMVICRDRVAAVNALLAQKRCDVVIADDGLQHYRLGRQIEIVMVDGERKFGNQHLLPAGPLREPLSRMQRADFVVVQGSRDDVMIQHPHMYAMQLQGEKFVAVNNPHLSKSLNAFAQQTVHAVAGIGNPNRFFAALRALQINVIEHRFKDHYLYQRTDLAFADGLRIIMTEKDAVKCKPFADEYFWYLPVNAELDGDFNQMILKKLKEFVCVK